ncbi:superoxide dismutase [Hysterangium stoloniferum]|nr:superoxide dismutase [Hysterangium stoloniferum]
MGTPSLDYEPIKRGRGRLFLTGAVLVFLMAGLFLWNRDSDDYVRGPVIKRAVAVITGPTVQGTVYFSQDSPKGTVTITGSLKNVAPNANRGFHIHELGDATDGCTSSGSHYNPDGKTHGSPQSSTRHTGDLGNVRSNSSGVVALDISDSKISLNGQYSIIGRTVVIHDGTDDLGKGENDDSLKTGNAGGRAGCAVIGIAS